MLGWKRAEIVAAMAMLLSLPASALSTWTGAAGNDWFNPDNWDPNGVPQAGASVLIKGTSAVMLTNSTAQLADFSIQNTASLTFSNWNTTLNAWNVAIGGGTGTVMATLYHAKSDTSVNAGNTNRIFIVCSNLVVHTNGMINADNGGYRGYTNKPGKGPGGSHMTNGAAYGGLGGGVPGSNGVVYGSSNFPVELGSGASLGDGSQNYGGDGGGCVRISAINQVIINGVVSANGSNGVARMSRGGGGGGSGGSILIACGVMSGLGRGMICATGGTAFVISGVSTNYSAGGGGGGRIGVWFKERYEYLGQYRLNGGPGGRWQGSTGEPGTVVTGWLPDFKVSSTSWVAKAMMGSESSQSVTLWNQSQDNQKNNLRWELVNTNDWVSPSATNGVIVLNGSDTLVLTNRSAGFGLGSHVGYLQLKAISDNGSHNFTPEPLEKTLQIRLEVMELTNSLSYLETDIMEGFNASGQTFEIWNAGSDSFAYRASGDVGWLSVAPTGGVCSGTHVVLTNVYSTAGLYAGTYTGHVTIAALEGGGMTRSIEVVMRVMNRSQLSMSPLELRADAAEEYDASNQVFRIWNGTKMFTLDWSAASGTNWLVLHNTNGMVAGGTQAVTVGFATAGLAKGTYQGQILVNGGVKEYGGVAAWDSPQAINVSVTVTRPVPELGLTWTNMELAVTQGVNAPVQTLGVKNATQRYTLDYTVADDAQWLAANPGRGSSTGEVDGIQIGLDTAVLDAGTYTCVVEVAAFERKYWVSALGSPAHARVVVRVVEPGSGFKRVISASRGEWADHVDVRWTAAPGEEWYEVWRGTTYDLGFAEKIAEVVGTNFTETTLTPGEKVYYWVRPISQTGSAGLFSTNAAGWYVLGAPDMVLASDGVFADKIRIGWSAVEAPEGVLYEVWRTLVSSSSLKSDAVMVAVTGQRTFDDIAPVVNSIYSYKVRAKMSSEVMGAFSAGDSGYLLGTASGVSATEGLFMDRVRVSWSAAAGAEGYEVWRGTSRNSQFATLLGLASGLLFDDLSGKPGTEYYYWVKSKNVTSESGLAGGARGYRASRAVNLEVRDLVWLSGVQGAGLGPDVVSYRVTNRGAAMSGNSARLRHAFYYAPVAAPDSGRLMLSFDEDMALASGASAQQRLNATRRAKLAIPDPGKYAVWVDIRPTWPSTLCDTNLSDNAASRAAPLVVRSGAGLCYRAMNDYDGDGCSDLPVYDASAGYWYIATLSFGAAHPLAWGALWGGAGFEPVRGDYNGDRASDLAIYGSGSGKWYVLSGGGTILAWGLRSMLSSVPTPGWYSGLATADACVFEAATGNWYVKTIYDQPAVWGLKWGGIDFEPVSGDFDGDGVWDYGVYDEQNGMWYVCTLSGTLIAWGLQWGGPGMEPVPGDYDGDGAWDAAVYSGASGKWYVTRMNGTVLAWNVSWGGAGMAPVSGDYDGDGIWDLACYDESSGAWHVRTLAGAVLADGVSWGGPGLEPVK